MQETCRLQKGSDPNPVIKRREEEGHDSSLKGSVYEAPRGFFYFFHEKLFVLLSSATGPGYKQGVDVNPVSKLEINEVFHPESPSSCTVRHAAPGNQHPPPGPVWVSAFLLPFSG